MEKLTHNEIDFLLNHARSNRENSASLAEVPGQRWAAAHREEVKMMDRLIPKLEAMNDQQECKGLVIRSFGEKWALCDGQPPEGVEPKPDTYYMGNIVKWFDTWDEANEMREIINAAYKGDNDNV